MVKFMTKLFYFLKKGGAIFLMQLRLAGRKISIISFPNDLAVSDVYSVKRSSIVDF